MLKPTQAIAKYRESVCRIACRDTGASGSGFFVAPDTVLTCDHVIAQEVPTASGALTRQFSSNIVVETMGKSIPATVVSSTVSTDPYFFDYAILRVSGTAVSVCKLGDYSNVVPGEELLIMGYPFGTTDLIAARAMVAATLRTASHRNQIVKLDAVELDGAINVGNSGGPAFSLDREEVVGVVSVRHGNIGATVRDIRSRLVPGVPFIGDLLDVLELSNDYLNPGLGRAISTSYSVAELKSLGLI